MISVMRDSVGRSVVGVRVAVVNGGSVDVVLVGVGVDSLSCGVFEGCSELKVYFLCSQN